MTQMFPRASLYGQLKFAIQICKPDTITSSKHFFFSSVHPCVRQVSITLHVSATLNPESLCVKDSQRPDEKEKERTCPRSQRQWQNQDPNLADGAKPRLLGAILKGFPGEPLKLPSKSNFPGWRISLSRMLRTLAPWMSVK